MPTRTHPTAAPGPAPAPLRLRNPTSPASLLVIFGLLALATTFWLVIAGARRTARTESRGDGIAAALLEAGQAMASFDWASPADRAQLAARMFAAASARGLFVEDLEVCEPRTPQEFCCQNKHYCIVLRPSPRRDDGAPAKATGDEPLEALAWPMAVISPAHAVFFHPEDAEPAFTRNLQSAYVDSDAERRPEPGRTHRPRADRKRAWDYRGHDDERWLLRDRRLPVSVP